MGYSPRSASLVAGAKPGALFWFLFPRVSGSEDGVTVGDTA